MCLGQPEPQTALRLLHYFEVDKSVPGARRVLPGRGTRRLGFHRSSPIREAERIRSLSWSALGGLGRWVLVALRLLRLELCGFYVLLESYQYVYMRFENHDV
jgi:hypothetical protein